MKLGVLIACALAGCYKPSIDESCTVRCTAAAPCSNGLTSESGLCRDPGVGAGGGGGGAGVIRIRGALANQSGTIVPLPT